MADLGEIEWARARPDFPGSVFGPCCADAARTTAGDEKGERMSLGRSGVRRRGRMATAATTVGALAVFQALAIVGAGAAGRGWDLHLQPCEPRDRDHDQHRHDLDGDGGDATTTSTRRDVDPVRWAGVRQRDRTRTPRSIVVLGQPSTDEQFIIDDADRDPFTRAISWFIDLGTGRRHPRRSTGQRRTMMSSTSRTRRST